MALSVSNTTTFTRLFSLFTLKWLSFSVSLNDTVILHFQVYKWAIPFHLAMIGGWKKNEEVENIERIKT
jgi:hypothetical protein